MGKAVAALLTMVLTLFAADSCGKYDVPAGHDQGDSAGDNQPNRCAVPPDKARLERVGYAPTYEYEMWLYFEDEDCGVVSAQVEATIFREGTYEDGQGKTQYVTWRDSKPTGNMIDTRLPWYTVTRVPKTRHVLGFSAVVRVDKIADELGVAWLLCDIERDGRYASEQPSTSNRVPVNGPGTYSISCAGEWPTG